jgi:hypothetical protein
LSYITANLPVKPAQTEPRSPNLQRILAQFPGAGQSFKFHLLSDNRFATIVTIFCILKAKLSRLISATASTGFGVDKPMTEDWFGTCSYLAV